ncbi:protoporphyrinogen/coproporphyrinogen oxidase [Candidatus Omnitrophota bacterium]
MNRKKSFTILGAGLAGLSTAFFLKKDYQIFEKENSPGGLCRSREFNGYIFDYDGHLLHFRNKEILNLVQKLLGDNLISIKRNSWISSFGNYTRYPFQANLFGLPKDVLKECLFGFVETQLNGRNKKAQQPNLKQWILRNFGSGISRHFMLPYNNKFWTIAPERLSAEWVDGYIPMPSLKEVLNGAIGQNKKSFGYNSQFWYPRHGGIEKLICAFRRGLGDQIHTLHQARRIDLSKRTVSFQNGSKVKFTNLISTLPLPELLKIMPRLPAKVSRAAGNLRYTSIFCLNLGIARPEITNRHWVYFPEKEFIFFRLGSPSSFSSTVAPQGKSSLYVEVAYAQDQPIDKSKMVKRILQDLYKTKILAPADTIEVCDPLEIKYGYIIYDKNYSLSTKVIHEYLNQQRVYSIGRYGRWKYMSMEQAILDGKETAFDQRIIS